MWTKYSVCVLLCIFSFVNAVSQSLGHPCQYDKHCTASENLFCENNNVCRCMIGFREMQGRCIATLGMKCPDGDECRSLSHSQCMNGICVCSGNYVPYNETLCLPPAGKNQPCFDDKQCKLLGGHLSACIQMTNFKTRTCQCTGFSHFATNGTCVPTRVLHQNCFHEECLEINPRDARENILECKDHRCECKERWYVYENRCIAGSTSILPYSMFLLVAFYISGKCVIKLMFV